MAYRKPAYPKKRYPAKKRYNNTLAKKAYVLAKKAYKMPELKEYTGYLAATNIPDTGIVTDLSAGIGQGTDLHSRIGDTLHPTSLRFRGVLRRPVNHTSLVRLVVYVWKNGIPMLTATDVLTASSVIADKSEQNRFSSIILYDKVFTMNAVNPERVIDARIDLKKVGLMAWEAASPFGQNKNRLFILMLSDEPTTANQPTLEFTSELFFRDP